ncbi:MAG: ABC transporter ATP-binding protein [Steroidobacteraceae bacterium]
MIKAERLTKRYDSLTAVDDVSFSVAPGEVLGFLGPNGAGKTTTMRMIAGFLPPTSGTASINGHDVEADPIAARRCLGYLPEGAPSYGEMTVEGFLRFIADLRDLHGSTRRQRMDEVVGRLALQGVLGQTIDTLSKGFRRRVGIAQAILHDPPVLIMDEPTDGLDPNQKHEVRRLIADMARDKIIVISTHILEEVDAVCTRAIIIAKGRVVADETPAALARRSRYHDAISVRFADSNAMLAARDALQSVPGYSGCDADGHKLQLTVFGSFAGQGPATVKARLDQRDIAVMDMRLEQGRLDDVFRSITA